MVPCFDENGSIEACARGLLELNLFQEVLLVDDGSTDGSRELCAALAREEGAPLEAVLLGSNRGKHRALREAARRVRSDAIAIFDADLTVGFDALELAARVYRDRGPDRIVIGSRLLRPMEDGAMGWLRRHGNRLLARWVSRLVGVPLTDVLCGLKIVPRPVWDSLSASSCRWGDLQLIFAAHRMGMAPLELPVAYRRRASGRSKMRLFSAGLRFAFQCLAYTLEARSHRFGGRLGARRRRLAGQGSKVGFRG